MQIKNLRYFFRGLFSNKDDESRVSDEFLTELINLDIDNTGKLKTRKGYEYWNDLLEDGSLTSSESIPVIADEGQGFQNKIQAIYPYTNVAGENYLIVVVDGRVYLEKLISDGSKKWECLNPSGNIDLLEKNHHIDVKSYLDIIFFNDYKNNVYMYNSRTVEDINIVKNKIVYFGGDKIYFRSNVDFSSETHNNDITAVNSAGAGSSYFEVDGDVQHQFSDGDTITVSGSTGGNDGDYTVSTGGVSLVSGDTRIAVDEAIPDGTVDGSIASQYRILIEDNTSNTEGKIIYDSLESIGFIGSGSFPVDTGSSETPDFGYCIKVETISGIKYFVLDNAKDQRSKTKCYIIKFSESLVAESFATLDMNATAEVFNFSHYDEKLYIFCKDGEINVLDYDLTNIQLTSNDVANLVAPVVSGTSQYSINVNENGIFVYSKEITSNSDWFQPIFFSNTDALEGESFNPDRVPYPPQYDEQPDNDFDDDYNFVWSENNGFLREFFIQDLMGILPQKEVFRINFYHQETYYDVYWGRTGYLTYYGYAHSFSNYSETGTQSFTDYNATAYDRINLFEVKQLTGMKWNYACLDEWEFQYNPLAPVDPPEYKMYASSNFNTDTGFPSSQPFSVYFKINYDNNFVYDKDKTQISPDMYTPTGGSNDIYDPENCYQLLDSDYNSTIFSSATASDYCLLVGLDTDGNYLTKTFNAFSGTKTWRYIFPLGKLSELNKIKPIVFKDDHIYFGNSMTTGTNGEDNGVYMKMNLDTFAYEYIACEISSWKDLLVGTDFWFLGGKDSNNNYRISNDWVWSTGFTVYDDFINLEEHNSNLFLHAYITTGSTVDIVDKIQTLGVPGVLLVVVGYDAISTLEKETQLKYQMAFQLYSGQTTQLSYPTEIIEIPDFGGGAAEPVKIIITGINLENIYGNNIYSKDDIEKILIYRSKKESGESAFSDPILVNTIEKDVNGDFDYGSYDDETWEDNTQDYNYVAFSYDNVLNYPVNHIEVHKNRLILVNRIDFENPSVIQYSDVDTADAIPPDNIRAIESGDGDYLTAAKSMGDYLYLFKTRRTYAILGDVYDGQLIDIDKNIGLPYKNMIIEFNNIVYILNNEGIYAMSGQNIVDIKKTRLDDLFDTDMDDSIDFDNIDENGFAYVDIAKRQIHFFVPRKKYADYTQTQNNTVIVYNVDTDNFKIYEYYNNIFDKKLINNLSGSREEIMTDYSGNIYKITKENIDNGNAIKFLVKTKPFTGGTELVKKYFQFIKIVGKNIRNARIIYYLDEQRKSSLLTMKKHGNGLDEGFVKVMGGRGAIEMELEINGEINNQPAQINEVAIGYSALRGILT